MGQWTVRRAGCWGVISRRVQSKEYLVGDDCSQNGGLHSKIVLSQNAVSRCVGLLLRFLAKVISIDKIW